MFRLFCILVTVLQVAVWGKLLNGPFEVPDPNGSTSYFIPPLNWQIENYAGLHSNFVPNPEYGQPIKWSISKPVQGSTFCLLSTGDVAGPGSDASVVRSSITQQLTLTSGSTIKGFYFFGTCDYLPYNDTGNIKLIPADPNDGLRVIILASVNVSDVGNYSATPDWRSFSYTVNSHTQGDYTLMCEVMDIQDTRYKTYLAIDNFQICSSTPLYGDADGDCAVDLIDYGILSSVWMANCNDPNTYDPNFFCKNVDFNNNTIIDPNDLILISEHWLENFKME